MASVSIAASAILFKLLRGFNPKPLATGVNLGFVAWHFLLAGRLYLARTREADRITYKYHLSFMYCILD